MANVSPDVQWMCIRRSSAFLHRARGIQKHFSREPLNLKGVNSFRYNGLINRRALGIAPAKDGKGVVLSYKKAKYQNKPGKSVASVTLKRNPRQTLNTIRSFMKGGHYRPNQAKLALRRASQLMRAQKPRKIQKKRSAKAKGAKAE